MNATAQPVRGAASRNALLELIWPWFASAFSGVLLALGYPPFNQGWIAWIALMPLLAAIWLRKRPEKRAWLLDLALGYVCGTFFFQLAFCWLTTVTLPGTIALGFYLALFIAAFAWLAGLLTPQEGQWLSSRRNLWLAVSIAAGWVALEYLRGNLFSGFGWNNLGVALWKNLPLIQIADITGVAGISFLLAFSNVTWLATIYRFSREVQRMRIRPHFDFTLTMALIGGTFVYGVFAIRAEPKFFNVKVAVVQANIPQDEKWDADSADRILNTYEKLSRQAIGSEPQLLVWPEAATPGPLALDMQSREVVANLAESGDFDFLLGTLDSELTPAGQKDYNAAFLITRKGKEVQRYWKIHLVPFGEFIPFRKSFPLFAWIAGGQVPGDFSSGTEAKVFEMRNIVLLAAPLICFEDTLPYLTRKFVANGAEMFVNITNDAWFLESQGSMQHLANAVFRTIEFRRPMLRAANSGVTCIIDNRGRVVQMFADAQGNTFIEGVMEGTVPVVLEPGLTLYAQWGDWLSYATLTFTGCSLLFAFRRRRTTVPASGLSTKSL